VFILILQNSKYRLEIALLSLKKWNKKSQWRTMGCRSSRPKPIELLALYKPQSSLKSLLN
jgi:hypothetical protein